KPDYQFGYPQGKDNTFYGGYGEYHNSQWTQPPAWTESGVMLVLPADPGLWSDVISRWESITINRLNSQTWSDNKAKLAFVENLLGERKPRNSHVKPFKKKYKDDRGRVKKCKCFIYGKEEHFAKDYRNFDDSNVYNISEGEVNIKRKQQHKPEEEKDFNSNEVRLLKELLKEKTEQVQQMIRDQAKEYYKGKITIKEKEELWQTKRSLLVRDLIDALKIIDQLKAEQIRLEEEKDEEIKRIKAQLQEKKDKEIEVQFSKKEFPPLGNSQIARPFMEADAHYSGNTTTAQKIRKITNQLHNVKVEFEIPNCLMFGTTAIIDTGASACCINKKVIPKEALEPLTQTIFFNGLNSRQQATHRIKQGYFMIEGNKLKIPLIYTFDIRDSNGIEMLIEANFLRSI
nr:RNA-directed DNA polymerase [Tanacetum cinerariifolium]